MTTTVTALALAVSLPAGATTEATAKAKPDGPASDSRITLTTWAGTDLADGTTEHLVPAGDGLALGPGGPVVEYTDPFGAGTAVAYETGTWTSPVVEPGYPIDEAVASWNAVTPTGTWIEVGLQGRLADGRWTTWFVMGRWASGDDHAAGDIHRTSVPGQDDADAVLATDTFVARTGHEPVAYRVRATLHRPAGSAASPVLHQVAALTNEDLPADRYAGTSAFTLGRHVEATVPGYSQLVHTGEYPAFGGGGTVWCSPTSVAMVQYSYGPAHAVPAEDLAGIEAPVDPQVAYAALGTWDHAYAGAGNWPFSAAYAHRFGLVASVTRLRSLAEAERFVEAGIPLVLSASWKKSDMPEAGYGTAGHLLVLVGFTADGDPIVNDPNKASDELVRNVYTRENLEEVWQTSTDGLAYVIRPADRPLPQNVPGLTPNW